MVQNVLELVNINIIIINNNHNHINIYNKDNKH